MNFESIKNELIEHILGMFVPFSRPMFEAIESLDIEALNAEIIRAHSFEVQEWETTLNTKPHAPEGSCNQYGWVYEAQSWVNSDPPLFVIPASWGASATRIWARYQAYKHKVAA